MPGTVASRAAALLMLWWIPGALMADAWAAPLERVEFESASQRLVSGTLILGERIQGDLARPDGAGPFPAVVGLHGCAGMHDTTKQKLTDELVARGYVVLLVDSYATRPGPITPAHQARLPPSSGADRMLTGRSSSWPGKASSIRAVWLRSASRQALGSPSLWRSPIRSNCSALQPISGSGRRLRSILRVSKPWRGRGYPRSFSPGPWTIGRRRQTAPIKLRVGAMRGRRSS